MSSRLNLPPPTRVALGTVQVAGRPVEIFLSAEWAFYLQSLTAQVNNNSATLDQVAAASMGSDLAPDGGDDAVFVPGPPGPQGERGDPAPSTLFGDGDAAVEFIPGPPGAPGVQGAPGPALFLLQDAENNDVFWPIKNT